MANIVPILAAILAGRKDPRVIGTALAGWQEGREKKLAERESAQENEARKASEQSETYARAVAQSQQQTDAVEHQEWLDSVTPFLTLKGLSPMMFPFNATKAQKKERTDLVASLESMEKRNPDLLQREDFYVVTDERPKGVPVSTVRAWRGEARDSTTGQAILPSVKPAATNLQGLQMMKAEADLMPKPPGVTFGPPQIRVMDGRRTDVQRGSDGFWYAMDGRKIEDPASVHPEPQASTAAGDRQRRDRQAQLRGRVRLAMRKPATASLGQLDREMRAAGMDVEVELDTAARAIEQEGIERARVLTNVDPVIGDEVTGADEILRTFDAELQRQQPAPGGPAPTGGQPARQPAPARDAARGRGVGPGPGGGGAPRSATRAEVEAVARSRSVTYAEAKRQLEARGVRVSE